ncbi:MAG: zinc ABC transporter substrate-binding protein [Deltaproteobacteria bacterium]|nr:MAG: zinc ABC transporter substrate-binding protein [Deltaproteobacteria bacterium]
MASAAPLRVLASFLPMYIFTANVAGDAPGVVVDLMLPAALGCPHDYALTPSDLRKIAAADLFIANGAGMEEFLGAPVRKANPRIRVVETAASVPLLRESHGAGGGDGKLADMNPHTWVSPKNAVLQVRAIEKALSEAVPGDSARFGANADAYARRLEALSREFEEASSTFRRRNIVTFHNVFDYLARDYGLTIVGEVETAPGQEPSAGEIRKLVRTMRDRGVPALFTEPQYPGRIAKTISREAGVPMVALDPVATGGTAPGYYEVAMRRNLRALREALSR